MGVGELKIGWRLVVLVEDDRKAVIMRAVRERVGLHGAQNRWSQMAYSAKVLVGNKGKS